MFVWCLFWDFSLQTAASYSQRQCYKNSKFYISLSSISWTSKVNNVKSLIRSEVTLKYMGSTLCLIAWAFPTKARTDDTFSGSWRFSTTVLIAFITLRAWWRSWLLRSISSGSSMSWNWLKYCLADGKFTKNLKRHKHFRHFKKTNTYFLWSLNNRSKFSVIKWNLSTSSD